MPISALFVMDVMDVMEKGLVFEVGDNELEVTRAALAQ